eukprot:TRINITY_DN17_c0_g1_i1.p1 TRINITY_DN17_c0_g1~~TRINITY_DN17_c0_g1_i1.p1  ORF type:complete len:329 (+),score=67.46 TRINITY_DN17_c0_g1_i1:55-1041(+)
MADLETTTTTTTSVVISTTAFLFVLELLCYFVWTRRESLFSRFSRGNANPNPLSEVPNVSPLDVLRRDINRVRQAEAILKDTDFSKRRDGAKDVPVVDLENLHVPTSITELPPTITIASESPENAQALADISVYVSQFLAKCHPMVGRPGPVCPFVPTSLKSNILRLVVVNTTHDATPRDVAQLVMLMKSLFKKMEPQSGKMALNKGIVLIFPNLVTTQQRLTIDAVQEALKERFVEDGMMLGEFHRCNASPGLRNENWFPLRTPHTCLAMRFMVPSDIPFLIPSKYDAGKIQRFCSHFLRLFQNDSSVHVEQAKLYLEKTAQTTQQM